MKTLHTLALALTASLAMTSLAQAQDRATKEQAVAMVAKGIAAIKAKGEAAYAEMTAPSKTFVDRDLYLVVYDMSGKCLAHGQNPKQVGKDLMGVHRPPDQDGAAQADVLRESRQRARLRRRLQI